MARLFLKKMKFTVITLFPDFIENLNNYSIIGRALNSKINTLKAINLRDFGLGAYHQVDDRPYGGGTGMLLRVDVMSNAIKKAKKGLKNTKVVLLAADGKKFTQNKAEEYSKLDGLILICGHYEGHDKRIEKYVDEKISTGDYVVSGGEIPAMIIVDATSRLIKGVLGKEEGLVTESHTQIGNSRILEHPQYTRPYEFEGKKVPDVLLSGDPKKVSAWQQRRTKKSKLV